MRVQVYSKPGCTLCEKAEIIIAEVCAELGEQFEIVDISGNAELMATYGEQIPVTFVDGKQHDFWAVDAKRLRQALA